MSVEGTDSGRPTCVRQEKSELADLPKRVEEV
jgi:hypothetical protein